MDCTMIGDLARRFEPVIRFDQFERWFPVQAETWVSHCSPEDWSSATAHKRGTAIMRTPGRPNQFGTDDVVGGCASGSNTRLALQRTQDPHAIGNPAYETFNPLEEDLFLDFAGWDNTASYSEGSRAYLASVFSTLGAALSPGTITPVPVSGLDPPPDFGPAPPTARPTVYAEVDWGGTYARVDRRRADNSGEPRDFPDDRTESLLANYVAVTYHYLYAATELPDGVTTPEASVFKREAQWEAITVFLRGDPGPVDRNLGRPRDFSGLRPRFVVYSQGYRRSDDRPVTRAECRPWDSGRSATLDIEKDGEHPVAYVTAGSHKHLFHPHAGTSTTTTTYNPWLVGAGSVLVSAAGVVAVGCAVATLAPPVAVVCWTVAAALFVIGLFLLLLSLIFKSKQTTTQDPTPQGEERDFSRGSGPAGTPSAGSPGTTGGSGVPAGASGAVPFELRIVDGFGLTPPGEDFPPSGACERPSWWDFSGRWGVKIIELTGNSWDSGSRRVDEGGRSRAYWNTYKIVEFWASHPEFAP